MFLMKNRETWQGKGVIGGFNYCPSIFALRKIMKKGKNSSYHYNGCLAVAGRNLVASSGLPFWCLSQAATKLPCPQDLNHSRDFWRHSLEAGDRSWWVLTRTCSIFVGNRLWDRKSLDTCLWVPWHFLLGTKTIKVLSTQRRKAVLILADLNLFTELIEFKFVLQNMSKIHRK